MKRRLGPLLAGIGAAAGLPAMVSGLEGGRFVVLMGSIVLGGVAWLVSGWLNRRRQAVADGWHPSETVRYHPAARHEASSFKAVATALSRVEARELGFSASFGVGLGFCLIILLLFGAVWGADFDGEPLSIPELFPIYVHPLAGLVVLATHRARTRSTRDGTQELFDSCPVGQPARTVGHLLTAWVPGLTALVFLLTLAAMMVNGITVAYGAMGPRQVALPFGAAILCVGAVALGVALARWAPWTPVPIVAVVLIGVVSIRLATAGDRTTEPLRQLSTWLNDPEIDLRFTAPHWAAHHLWIVALVGLVGVLALARDIRRGWVPIALGVLAAAATMSAIAATRPIGVTDAERIAALINQPDAYQRCVQASEVPVCAYRSADALAQHLAEVIDPVAEAAPRGALADWMIRQGFDVRFDQLDPEVRNRLAPTPADQRVIPLSMSGHPEAAKGARLWVALTAVGVTEQQSGSLVMSLEGEARGVIALWLATRGVDERTAETMTSFHPDAVVHDVRYSRPWPDSCYAGPTPVIWAATDLDAARLLIGAPEDQIDELLRSDWTHLTNPRTSTAELLDAAGLDPVADRPGRTRTATC